MTNQTKYRFFEPFRVFDSKGTPYGLTVEQNSVYTHLHTRVENDTFYITCAGNSFLCRTPALRQFDALFSCGFHLVEGNSGFRILFGYDPACRTGCALDYRFEDGQLSVTLNAVERGAIREITRRSEPHPCDPCSFELRVSVWAGSVSTSLCETAFDFALPEDAGPGLIGIALTSSVGEMAVRKIMITGSDPLEHRILSEKKTVELSLRGGGSMPYRLSWYAECWDGTPYLVYALDGGIQYRDTLPGYPRRTGQYAVERHVFRNPWIAIYDNKSSGRIGKYSIFNGSFSTTDPGLVWHVLLAYFGVVRLPLSASVPLPEGIDPNRLEISFGYEKMSANGYKMQTETDTEEIFDFTTGERAYIGKARGVEHIMVRSQSAEAISVIPPDVYDREAVLRHLENNHFFTEGEPVGFTAVFVSDKPTEYLSMTAALCNVYGDFLGMLDVRQSDGGWRFLHESLPVGVYRAMFVVSYGDTEYARREIIFEVFDPSGERCAPLESGLPVLFSMPNEQKYLDRDAFDLYNPVPDCNMEHFYSVSAIPGDVGLKRRVWETNRIFGRKWYVWDSFHRTLTREEFEKYGEELIRRSDFCYYPAPHEWAVMRHDPLSRIGFMNGGDNPAGLFGDGIMGYLHDFLRLHPEIEIGLTADAVNISDEQREQLLSLCLNEWLDYVNGRINKDFRENTEWMRSINPRIKRACYGPFNIYGGTLSTDHACRYIGFAPEGSLAEYMFDGFAQLEDYPYSCAYHTYQGAFFAAHALLHNPNLAIYPEEYTASDGGCIDGAVKDAHPPLGKYNMKPYFNVTHSYEYVYNTAHLTPNGFRYWDKRGFMQRDFTQEFADAFVRGWKNVLQHEPDCPLRCAAYLSEIPDDEDRWNVTAAGSCISNRSDEGLSYIFDTSRLCGLPNGFPAVYDSLMNLTSEMTDCVVLPSLKHAPAEAVEKLRELHAAGVALIAVSDVDRLEDLFGVKKECADVGIMRLTAPDGSEEGIYPVTARFLYRPDGGTPVLWAEDENRSRYPAVIRSSRTLLINASADELGRQSYGIRGENYYAANISKLLRKTVSEQMLDIVSAIAVSDGCGITLLKDKNGDTLLLAVDYSDYDDPDGIREYTVTFRFEGIREVEALYGNKPILLRKDGSVRSLVLKLQQQECALMKLTL